MHYTVFIPCLYYHLFDTTKNTFLCTCTKPREAFESTKVVARTRTKHPHQADQCTSTGKYLSIDRTPRPPPLSAPIYLGPLLHLAPGALLEPYT